MKSNAEIGRVCVSRMGRDEGRSFIIVALTDDDHAYIADGTMRKLAKPKKKKLKHLRLTPYVLSGIAEKLLNEQKVFDKEVWSAIGNIESQSALGHDGVESTRKGE